MPTRALQGGRRDYDLPEIKALLIRWKLEAPSGLYAVLELLQALPPKFGGSIASYCRGQSRGFEWMLTALGITFISTRPKTWQAVMHADVQLFNRDPKIKSIEAAKRLWPGQSLYRTPRARKSDDGIAEALLIAEYARRLWEQVNAVEGDDVEATAKGA